MIAWLSANIGTILIGLVVLAVVIAIVCSIRKDKRSGKSSCGGNCGSCGGCGGSCNVKHGSPCVRPRQNRFGRTGKRWRYAL